MTGLGGARLPWREAEWRVVDVETTSLDPGAGEVISYAVVPIRGGRIVAGKHQAGLVRPHHPPTPESIRVHGLRARDLEDAPAAEEVAPALVADLAGKNLVVHYAMVERTFLAPLLATAGMRYPRRVVDTEVLGRLWLSAGDRPVPHVLPLSRLAGELGLPVHQPHDALGDALTTAQAFLALASHLEATGPETVGSLLRANRRLAAMRLMGVVSTHAAG
jgi:DNA polymerase-3 subunit epsilon